VIFSPGLATEALNEIWVMPSVAKD